MEITNEQIERITKTFGENVADEVLRIGYIPADKDLLAIKRRLEEEKNFDFTQINNKYTWDLISVMSKENPTALQLLMFLGKNMDNYNAVSCSQALLGEVLEVGRTTVHKAVKYLEKNGYISIAKQGSNNVYILNNELFWKNKRTHHKYCQFSGSLLLSRKENQALFEKLEGNRDMEFDLTKTVKAKRK
ncbi:MarR family transcriptional regulator [Vibrio alginolyticus]|uniref:MarR family transcriptional regulator n=1 Tax=Vibrio alginolyticus TaxID=663 RepID=UPI001BD30CE7|nr:helix-turn-helix domain-containing protein [Vibrio alginolyticus]MBS9944769.1 MarR family transcriptional regulator [Vibrio alginolyticus]